MRARRGGRTASDEVALEPGDSTLPGIPTRRPGTPALEVEDLQVRFPSEDGSVHAVRGVSFAVEPGEVLAIVGESGSGKSVTSMSVMGLLPETARVGGAVRLHGVDLLGRPDGWMSKVRGNQIGMVFQDPLSALTPVYTVGDQIVEALQTHTDVNRSQAWDRAVELLDLVGIPGARVRAKAFPHEFSGGQRQRAMIAMAIANDPDVIIADEPTTALDVTIQAQILDVLKTAQAETGAAVVMITHDLGVVAGIADKVAVMYAGRIVEHGPVDDVYARTQMPYTIGLLGSVPRPDRDRGTALAPVEGNPPSMLNLAPGCPFAARCPMAIEICRSEEPPLARVAGAHGHTVACHRAAEIVDSGLGYVDIYPVPRLITSDLATTPREQREEVLTVDNLVKHFPLTRGAVFRRRIGTVQAVDGISFDVRAGECLALVGESGCGKTTTLLEILDLQTPQDGTVVVMGRDTRGIDRRGRRALRRDLQVVFQDPMASLDPRLPVFDIIAEPLEANGYPRADLEKRVRELMRLVGLEPSHANRYPQHFSGGQRQRIGIARALALEPKLLVLDEPVSALDVSIQAGVINLLDELRARLGLSYLFVAHDLSVVRHIADRVAVMYLGRVVEIGEVEEVFSTPSHPYTQALLSAIPVPDPPLERQRERIILRGDLPSPADPPSGCRFRTRCQKFLTLGEADQQRCTTDDPSLRRTAGHQQAACHFAEVVEVF